MRICILTKGEPYGWTRYYIGAFRACGHDTLVVGPTITQDELRGYQLEHLDANSNRTDIETSLGSNVRLADVLPQGWHPDLVVAISMAGTPLCPQFAGVSCPRVYLSIDTWQSPRDYLDAAHYDFVFVAQKSFVPRMRRMGARNVKWLPLACNPKEHFPVDIAPRADVSFVGTISLPIHQQRLDLIERLKQEVRFLGKSAQFGPGLCALSCAGKLTFNHSAVNDVNMRIFEALAMGCVLLTNVQSAENGLLDLFKDGEHLIVYEDGDDLIRQALRYLDNDDSRQRIALAGRLEVLARHTYQHRVDTILQTVEVGVAGWGAHENALNAANAVAEALPAGVKTVLAIGDACSAEWSPFRTPRHIVTHPTNDTDAVMICARNALETPLGDLIRRAASALREGGALVLSATTSNLAATGIALEPAALQRWLAGYNFVLQTATLDGETLVLSARKRISTIASEVDDAFLTLPANCMHVRDGIREWLQEFCQV